MADITDKGQELIEEANESYEERKEKQKKIVDDISQDHGGEHIQTKCEIAPGYTVDIDVQVNGRFVEKMASVEELTKRVENGEDTAMGASEIMDKAAQLLADVVDNSDWDKDLFYNIYLDSSPDVLGGMFEAVGGAINRERKRKEEGIGGFRQNE